MKTKIILPDSHRRSLSVTARLVEAGLDEMEDLLRTTGRKKLTEKIAPSFSPEGREDMLVVISRMREANAEMFRTLDLRPAERTEAQVIRITA